MTNEPKKKFYIITLAKSTSVRIEAASEEEAHLLAAKVEDYELDESSTGWEQTDCWEDE